MARNVRKQKPHVSAILPRTPGGQFAKRENPVQLATETVSTAPQTIPHTSTFQALLQSIGNHRAYTGAGRLEWVGSGPPCWRSLAGKWIYKACTSPGLGG